MIAIDTNGENIAITFSVRDLLEGFRGSPLEESLLEDTGNTVEFVDGPKFAEAVALALTEEDESGGCKLDTILDEAVKIAITNYDDNGVRFVPDPDLVGP